MAVYIAKDITSDVNPITKDNTPLFDDVDMSTGAGTDGSRGASIPSQTLRSFAFITVAGVPNFDAWESGGIMTIELEVDAGNMNLRARVRIGRINSSGTVLQVGAYTNFVTLNTSQILSPTSPTWTGAEEACGNRLFMEFEVENTDTMMALTLTVGLGTLANEIVSNITENAGGCVSAVDEPEQVSVIA